MRTLFALATAILVLSGCSSGKVESTVTEADVAPKKTVAAWPTDVKIFRNEKGEVTCPVMKASIASVDGAVGHQDLNGTRYYFCCDMCPEKFKSNPALYTK